MDADEGKSDLLKTWLPSLVGAGGLLFGATTFFVQYFYLPQREPHALEVRSSLEKVGENEHFIVIKGTISVKNIMKTRVETLGAWYNVTGSRIKPAEIEVSDPDYSKFVADQLRGEGPMTVVRHCEYTDTTTVLASRLFGDTWWFDPAEEYQREFHVYLPRNRYDWVQLEVQVAFAKDRKEASAIWKVEKHGSISAEACRKLPDFQKDRTKCKELDPDRPQDEEFKRKYGIAFNDSQSELNLLRMSTLASPLHKK
jgi:hypothetical protein